MSHWFARHGNTLIPADDRAGRAVMRLAEGEAVQLTLLRSRSPQWHRLFMGGCAAIAANCEPALTADAVKEILKLMAGHVVTYKKKNGDLVYSPKSIAFSSLSADDWQALFPSLEKAAMDEFGFSFDLFSNGYGGHYE